jgi:hypothetical protein
MFQVLLAHNADPTFKNELNETAYSLAVASGRYLSTYFDVCIYICIYAFKEMSLHVNKCLYMEICLHLNELNKMSLIFIHDIIIIL